LPCEARPAILASALAMNGLPYSPRFAKGVKVRIASDDALNELLKTWRFHHRLQNDQLTYHDAEAFVEEVYSYHGGDILYVLRDIPGIWHEVCLNESQTT
jgi:hypothetical protein